MSANATSIFERLQHKTHLPYIKAILFQIQEKIRNPNAEVADIAKLLRNEPLIATKVTLMANRLKSGRNPGSASLVGNLNHAIAYIGLRALEDILIVAFITSIEVKTRKFDLDDFWRESGITAAIAEKLAIRFLPGQASLEAFLAGFLCNIGKVVSAFYWPEQTDEVFTQSENINNQTTWLAYELEHGLPDHRSLGEIACAFWGLPAVVLESVEKHHGSKRVQGTALEIHDVVTLANQLSHWIQLRPERIDRDLLDVTSSSFALSKTDIENLAQELAVSIQFSAG